MLWTLEGLFLVGAVTRPRRGKGQIGKIHGQSPGKAGKSRNSPFFFSRASANRALEIVLCQGRNVEAQIGLD